MEYRPMKKYRLLLFFLVSFLSSLCADLSFAQDWKVVRWVDDGDTIVLKNSTRIRYIGINTPEVAHKVHYGPQ